MPDNQTEIIKISSIEPQAYPDNTDYQVKDTNGRVFHVYKFKKGTREESTAYQQMMNMGLRLDLALDKEVIVEAWYAEVPNKHCVSAKVAFGGWGASKLWYSRPTG